MCDGSRCSDGCGGTCECAAGTVCNAKDICLTPEKCTDTCASAGYQCGDICGESCGDCSNSESCIAGSCQEAISCSDCPLRLELVERSVEDRRLTRVVLAIQYAPAETEPRPRLADFRIRADRPVQLMKAEEGLALASAEKELYVDEITNNPWKVRADGSYQMLVYGYANTRSFVEGRLVTFTFELDEPSPVTFSFVRHEQTFAPANSDAALQSSNYDAALVVSR